MDLVLLLAVFNEEQHFGHVVPLLATHPVPRARTGVRDGGPASALLLDTERRNSRGQRSGTRLGTLEPGARQARHRKQLLRLPEGAGRPTVLHPMQLGLLPLRYLKETGT